MASADKPVKKRFLVTYDYGQGAIWAWLHAYSKEQIAREFPELMVEEDPSEWSEWMRQYVSSSGQQFLTLDIEDKDSPFLAAIIRGRRSQP